MLPRTVGRRACLVMVGYCAVVGACGSGDNTCLVEVTVSVDDAMARGADRIQFRIERAPGDFVLRTYQSPELLPAGTWEIGLAKIPARLAGMVQLGATVFVGGRCLAVSPRTSVTLVAGQTVLAMVRLSQACPDALPADAGPVTVPDAAAIAQPDAGVVQPSAPDGGGADADWIPLPEGEDFAAGDMPRAARFAPDSVSTGFAAWTGRNPQTGKDDVIAAKLPGLKYLSLQKDGDVAAEAAPALVATRAGEAYMAWVESGKAVLRRCTDTGCESPGAGALPLSNAGDSSPVSCVSLVLDRERLPVVAWTQGTPRAVFLRRFNGAVWESLYGGSINGSTEANSAADCPLLVSTSKVVLAAAWTEAHSIKKRVYVQQWMAPGRPWSTWGVQLEQPVDALGGFVVDDSGAPVIAWHEYNGQMASVSVKRWNGTAWESPASEPAALASPMANGPPALAVAPDDKGIERIFLTWFELDATRPAVRTWQLAGGAWAATGRALFRSGRRPEGLQNSASDGTAFVTFTDFDTGNRRSINVYRLTGPGTP